MRRLAWLTLLASARAAPDTDTQLKRAAALARWVDRTGPAPESWTVAGPKDVTVGQEVHAGKIKKVYRATVDLGGSSAVVKTIEQKEGGGTLLMELLFLHALRGAPGVPDLYGAWFDDERVTYVVGDGGEPVARKKGPKPILEARGKCLEGTCALLSEKTHVYDVANRPWLLPYIADRATGGDRDFLVALIRHASAEDPDDRPSFAELVGAIDRRVDGATLN